MQEYTALAKGTNSQPLLVVLSGQSGVGKDTILRKMKKQNYPQRHYAITATTRKPRPEEKDGIDYYFLSESVFHQMVAQGAFLEWAKVYNNWYGVPKRQIDEALAKNKDVIIKVDVQGAATIKKAIPQAILIFLSPPSQETLANRLDERNTESRATMKLRTTQSKEELQHMGIFNYIVINHEDKAAQAVTEINNIIDSEKLKLKP
ncbi:MAG: guanylate kinase [Dehalococcoidia bacterium]|nr:guanylate kinase [Dehalococcoidia bacterium]